MFYSYGYVFDDALVFFLGFFGEISFALLGIDWMSGNSNFLWG